MSTARGRPQRGGGSGLCGRMWTGVQKPDSFADVINGWPLTLYYKGYNTSEDRVKLTWLWLGGTRSNACIGRRVGDCLLLRRLLGWRLLLRRLLDWLNSPLPIKLRIIFN